MDLKDFVTRTLLDVVEGIVAAQDASPVGALVAPSGVGHKDAFAADSGVYHRMGLMTTTVKFDVAVTAETSQEAKGTGGVKVIGIGAGLEGAMRSRDESVSRVQFAVPVVMPPNDKQWARLRESTTAASPPSTQR